MTALVPMLAGGPKRGTAILGPMSGRYAFSLPEPRQRDGWFRLGTLDITTTVFVALVSGASMIAYAIAPVTTMNGAFETSLVRSGELWRLVTWPLINPPSIWALIDIALFWYFGHMIEDRMGRKPFAVLLVAMTVIPATVATLLNVTNSGDFGRWSAYSAGLNLFVLALLVVFAVDNPGARFFFGIPAWVFAAAIVAINFLQLVSVRAWAQIILGALVLLIACFGVAQRGMLDAFEWIPRFKALAGGPVSPYGEIGSAKPKRKRGKKAKGGTGAVVAGPWGQPTGGPTPLEQAELDVLLDRISAGGIDSLTKEEKARLNALSKRMRDS